MTTDLERIAAQAMIEAGLNPCLHGHTMECAGGCNASCDDACICSVPVHECSLCGDCDYGDNAEADTIRAHCRETRA